jgi:hypothetical protein
MNPNTKYTDSVFSFLFSNPGVLRELYYALTGILVPPDIPIVINTLSNVLFMDRINDISFAIGAQLVILIEHQSTINPNMALRLLLYITRIYETIIEGKNIYASKRLTIPRPQFFVLYNGVEPYPDEQVLRLSDSFERGIFSGGTELELVARVININRGKNAALVGRSETLKGYSEFTGRVRENTGDLGREGLEKAIQEAVGYCIEHGILVEFLKEHGREVINMLTTEWNWDDALAVRFEEGLEEGWEKGREEEQREIARNALMEGASFEFVQKITGLDSKILQTMAGE